MQLLLSNPNHISVNAVIYLLLATRHSKESVFSVSAYRKQYYTQQFRTTITTQGLSQHVGDDHSNQFYLALLKHHIIVVCNRH